MADFRQLALQFVLEDQEEKQTLIARQAATEIQTAQANTNPVARWVESVQPWMPGNNEEDVVEGQETPDWTSRAKALEFLSRTLHHLDTSTLKPSQVKLLVGFFGAMFDIDHKAGIMASATALFRIKDMKSFQPSSANEIIQKLCALKDDFSRQTSKTRLAVYELLQSLLSNADVTRDLQKRHGESAGFMKDLLVLCSSERDPDCLLIWFDILRHFLSAYSASQEIIEEVYNMFKAYFPITLPRIAQSNVTPDELKMSLRRCFSANQRLAHLTIPFLVGKMDQGSAVTVNVKIDILKTLQHCLENYKDQKMFITPYVNQIWGSLKYEVRNGESEDTIWATLEVLKTLATRLDGDDLRDYALTVTRDCVTDLSNITYTAPAGRLLVSVLSANVGAFVLMVAPILTHVKENLRHPKTPDHSQDLLKILHVVLETRLLLAESDAAAQDKADLTAVDSIFKGLYGDVLKSSLQKGSRTDATEDEIKICVSAVQAAGALIGQQASSPISAPADPMSGQSSRLLPDNVCLEIVNDLFTIVSQTAWAGQTKRGSDDLINETTQSLQRATHAYPGAFEILVDQSISIIRQNWPLGDQISVRVIQTLGPIMAYIGCSDIVKSPTDGLTRFTYLVVALTTELKGAIEAKADPQSRRALVISIESALRYFNKACQVAPAEEAFLLDGQSWYGYVTRLYPQLLALEPGADDSMKMETSTTVHNGLLKIRDDFLLISLFVARLLYRRIVKVSTSSEKAELALEDSISVSDASEYQYLHHVSSLAGFVIHELSESQQGALRAERFAIDLFHDESIHVPDSALGVTTDDGWSWLTSGRLSVLSLGILQGLRPKAVARLFDAGIAQGILMNALTASTDTRAEPVALPILSVLSNKYIIENDASLVSKVEQHMETAFGLAPDIAVQRLVPTFAIMCGVLRRYGSKKAEGVLKLIREGPAQPNIGRSLARRMEMLVAPQTFLTKDQYASVKPLWMQRLHFELIGPMLELATDSQAEATTRSNYSLAVILMLRHMTFSIYEAEAEKVLRISISTAQNLESGPEVLASLDVLQNILLEAPERGQDHIRSIINICIGSFTTKKTVSQENPTDPAVVAETGKLALEIVGGMPRMFEARRLIPFVSQLERELTLACGHSVRELRRLARLARQAWAPLK